MGSAVLMRMESVGEHVGEFSVSGPTNDLNDERLQNCGICYEKAGHLDYVCPQCHHMVCVSCLGRMKKPLCPYCRRCHQESINVESFLQRPARPRLFPCAMAEPFLLPLLAHQRKHLSGLTSSWPLGKTLTTPALNFVSGLIQAFVTLLFCL